MEERNVTIAERNSPCVTDAITIDCIKSQYGSDSFTPTSQEGTLDAIVMGYIGQYASQSDLTKFLQQYRSDQSSYKIQIEAVDGAINDQNWPGDEAMLDVEMVAGIAAPLNIQFLSYGGLLPLGDGFFDGSLEYILNKG